jgi:uncharacterized glyoxalase superfamily protein PhnB
VHEEHPFSPDKAQGSAPGVCMHIHCLCADSLWAKTMASGATPTLELADTERGARHGRFRDPLGQVQETPRVTP